MTAPLSPEDPAHRALDANIKRTVATSALRHIRRHVGEVEAEDRTARRAAWIAFVTVACVAVTAAILIFAKQRQATEPDYPNRRVVFAAPQSPHEPVRHYAAEWHARVESTANDSYAALVPSDTYGKVTLTSFINADGSVWHVERKAGSGIESLDAAAEKLIHNAAPFKPFPPELREIADTIVIIRTFTFERGQSK